METGPDKARLAAYADGELSPEEAAEVVMHLASHDADRKWVDALIDANDRLAEAFGDPIHEPVPQRIRDAIFGAEDRPAEVAAGNILPFRRPRGATFAMAAGLAAAAAVILAVLVIPRGSDPGTGMLMAGPQDPGGTLAQALRSEPSGETVDVAEGGRVELVASFLADGGRFCREFRLGRAETEFFQHAVACRGDDALWNVEIVVTARSAGSQGADGYTPASGAADEMIAPALDALGAGLALSPDEEAAQLR